MNIEHDEFKYIKYDHIYKAIYCLFRTSEVSFPSEGEGDGQGLCQQRPAEAKPSEPALRSSEKP